MGLSERIEERLKALGISQAELARRADIPQSTVNTMIRRGSRSSPHLVKIAQVLGTTPAYLTGEVDDPKAEFPDFALSAPERADVEMTRLLPDEDRKLVHSLIARLAECAELSSDGRTLHDRQIEFRHAS